MKIKDDGKMTEVVAKKENPMRKYTNKLDYGLETAQERIKLLNSVLYDENGYCVKFFEDMFDQDERERANSSKQSKEDRRKFVNLLPTCSQALSEDIYECKQIEKYADYILGASDQPRMGKQQEYNFYNEIEFKRLLNREELYQSRLEAIGKGTDDFDLGTALSIVGDIAQFDGKTHFSNHRIKNATYINNDTKMAYLKRIGENYVVDSKQRITKKDLENPNLEYVKDCKSQIDTIQKNMSNGTIKSDRWVWTSIIKSLRDSQIQYKDYKNGTIYFKQPLKGSAVNDYGQVDFFDKSHVLALLNMSPRQITPEDDLSLILYDLELLVNKIGVRNEDVEIIEKYRNGITQDEISKETGMTRQSVNQIIDRLASGVIQEYESAYEDWYYLDRVKGKYKKCSKCDEVKLQSWFRKEAKVKDGLRGSCKICDIR